jgi:predicted amidophosphoribosyltransferase
MSENPSWIRVDESVSLYCCPDAHQHDIFYSRIYTSGQGFRFSETNNLISNYQKGPNAQPNILSHRARAIRTFVKELEEFFSKLSNQYSFYIVPTPPSTLRTNPQYDPRVEEVAERASQNFPHIEVASCVETILEIEKSKANTERRSAERIYDTLSVIPEKLPPDNPKSAVLILDDVLTSGAHFEAMRRRLREHLRYALIGGVYWARAVHLNPI